MKCSKSLVGIVLGLSMAFVLPAQAQDDMGGGLTRQQADAGIDRNIILPSAETIGEGKWAFNSYELFLAGLTYGLSDTTQVSLTTLVPIFQGTPLVLAGAAKIKLLDEDDMIVSVQSGLIVASLDGDVGGTFGGSVIADFILDPEKRAVLSTSLLTTFAFGADVGVAPGALLAGAVAFSYQTGDFVKLLAEVIVPVVYRWELELFEIFKEGTVLNYGVRFFGESFSVDLTFIRPIHPDAQEGNPFILGLPYLAFSSRW
jgi:hypothetical protein